MSLPLRKELVAENTIFGTQQALWKKKDSEVSQFLKKIFRLWLLPPAEVSDCIALEFIANHPNEKRVEEICDYLLENYIDADSTFPPPVWSECFASSLRPINACQSKPISMHYFTVRILILLFLYLHCKIHRMRPASK